MADYIETHGNKESSGTMDTGDWDTLSLHGLSDESVTVRKNFTDARLRPEEMNFDKNEGADLLSYIAHCLQINEQGEMFEGEGTNRLDRERESGPQVTVSAGEEMEQGE